VGRRYDVRVEVDSGEEVTVERHRDGLGEADRVTDRRRRGERPHGVSRLEVSCRSKSSK